MRQHLLQGFGFNSNLRWIRIARNDKAIMDSAFQNQIMQTVSQIENIYWDLVNAYENVKVQQRALELANKTLSDTQKQVDIGTLAPITVVQSQSSVATAKQNLITAQTNLQLQQLLMKNAITRNNTDPILATAPVIPTDTLQDQRAVRNAAGGATHRYSAQEPAGNCSVATEPDQPRSRIEGDQEPAVAERGSVCVLWRTGPGGSPESLYHLR